MTNKSRGLGGHPLLDTRPEGSPATGGTPFAALTPAPPTISFVIADAITRILRAPIPACAKINNYSSENQLNSYCFLINNYYLVV